MKIITLFGDSICNGYGVALHNTWAVRLSEYLSHVALINNCSCNGRTSRQGLEDLHYQVLSKKNDIVLIHLGLNDGNFWDNAGGLPRVSALCFYGNMEEMVCRIKHAGMTPVLLGIHTVYKESVCNYNYIVRSCAIANNVDFIDVKDTVDSPDYLMEDMVHLNLAGHDAYLEAVKYHMREICER